MREHYSLTRLFVKMDIRAEAVLDLSKDQAHYLCSVLRRHVDDTLRIFNGRDGEWLARIDEINKRAARLVVVEKLRDQNSAIDITLCFAPLRKHRTAFIIEKATELGVHHFQPVVTSRTQFSQLNLTRAEAQIIEAAEQSERLDVPRIGEPLPFNEWVSDLSHPVLFADESGEAKPALEVAKTLKAPLSILIGPEGGFTEQEREILYNKDEVFAASLGPRILRADTAAIIILALWQAVNGDS